MMLSIQSTFLEEDVPTCPLKMDDGSALILYSIHWYVSHTFAPCGISLAAPPQTLVQQESYAELLRKLDRMEPLKFLYVVAFSFHSSGLTSLFSNQQFFATVVGAF